MAARLRLLNTWSRNIVLRESTLHCNCIQSLLLSRQRSCSASILRLKKDVYPLMYKVRLVEPDGSSYTVRYHSPKKLILLPIDPSTLTQEELLARQKILRPEKPKVVAPKLDKEDTEIQKKSWRKFVKRKT